MPLRRLLPTALLLAGACLLVVQMTRPAAEAPDHFAPERAQLERRLKHARPGSAEAFKLRQKIERLDAYRAGRPMPTGADEFARILAERKIPADRAVAEYDPGYQERELVSAKRRKAGGTLSPRGLRQPLGAPLPWVSRGPGNVAGRARGIVVDPDDPSHNTWFVASVGGGVWKTTDGGATWTWLTPDFPVLSTSAIAMAASNPDIIYVGTGESFYNIDVINGDGILKSTDRGATWTPLASTVGNPAFNNVARIIVDPDDPDIVLAATTRGRYKEYLDPRSSIFRSTDGGATWTEVYASTTIGSAGRVKKVLQIVASPSNFDFQYATIDEGGILRSTNAGLTWSAYNGGLTDFSGRFEIAVSPANPSQLYALAEGATRSELYRNNPGTSTWSRTFEVGTEPNWLGAQGWYDNTIVGHPTLVNTVFVGGIYLWRVDLTGTNRVSSFIAPGVHPDQHGLEIIDAPGGWRILNTNDGGVAVSTLEDTGWQMRTDGLVTTQFYGIDKRPGASAYVGGTQDNGTWQSPIDPTALTPWTHVIGGDGYETSWHFDDPSRIIGGYQYNGLTRSLDGGATWSAANVSVSPPGLIDQGSANAPFITKINHHPDMPDRLFAVGRRGVWRSNDFGGTWSLSAIASGTWGPNNSFHAVKMSRANPDVVYAGSRMDGSGQIHVSTDAGVTFTPLPNYTTHTMGVISGLATHPTDEDVAYVLFGFAERPKILKTSDGGATWQDITGFESSPVSTNGFPDVAVYDLVVFSNDTNRLWAATEIGLVESLDGGASWALADNGLPNVAIWQLIEDEDEIVAGTHGRGIWSVTMPELIAGKTFNPLLEKVFQRPDGMLQIDMNLRSPYDTTTVLVDGVPAGGFGPNAPKALESLVLPVVSAGTRSVQVSAAVDTALYESIVTSIDLFAPQTPQLTYVNDFETSAADFVLTDFNLGTEPGFSGDALHTLHPYHDDASSIALLTVPIIVAQEQALIEFDELALVEPGDPGTVFGDPNFWDYVIVEGSKDGCMWTPLLPGYDARAYPEWETAYYANAPDASLLHPRVIDLHDTYVVNDLILVRFRMYADASVTGWGWVIDNLRIQEFGVSAVGPDAGQRPAILLAQNMPNPVRSGTAIRFALPSAQPVALELFDVQGRLVRSLATGLHPAGEHEITWDGRDAAGREVSAGVYFYRLATGNDVLRRKLLVVK
jgi:photosystem II stability/assembly factor-like uncharacterized protein